MDLYIVATWLKARAVLMNERGANLVEYLLLIALIAIIVIIVVSTFGGRVSSKFSSTNSALG